MSKMRVSHQGNVDPGQRLFDDVDTIDVMSLFGALRRRKWMIAAVSLITALLGGLLGTTIDKSYTAETSVLIEPVDNPVLDRQAVARGLTIDEQTIATQIQLLQSRSYLARVMEDLDLYADPEFNPALVPQTDPFDEPPLSWIKQPLEKAAGLLPQEWLMEMGFVGTGAEPLAIDADVARLSRERALNVFAGNLRLFNDGASSLIRIAFQAGDPDKAARIANRIAEIYVNEQLNSKLLATDRTSSFYDERLAELREEVRASAEAVAAFASSIDVVPTEGTTLSQQDLSELNRTLIVARGELAEKQARLRLARDVRASGQDLGAISEVANSPLILRLRDQETELLRRRAEYSALYGPRHPRMLDLEREQAELQAKISAEVDRITRTLENEVQVTASRIADIEARLGTLKSDATLDRAAEVKLAELQRQAASSQQIYEDFLQRSKELRENQTLVQPDVRIVATAKPPTTSSSPGVKLFSAAGLLIGFTVSSLVVVVLDRLDRGVRSAREVERLLGLNTLGMVPLLTQLKRNQKPYQYLMDKPLSAYAEAVRSVYMAIKLSNVDKQPKVVLVTSSLPQEGKTTFAVSLATFAARSHKRVLLIDLDLRHPSVHRELGWQVSAGLVEYMAGDRALEEIIQHDLETGLHFLPIKGQTTNPTDLLDSQKMRLLIESLRDSYDYIVLDSAPLASVTDTRVAALLADKVLFCLRWGQTMIGAAEDSIQALAEVGIEPAGAVLTMVDMKKHARYGYGDVGQYYTQSQKYYVN